MNSKRINTSLIQTSSTFDLTSPHALLVIHEQYSLHFGDFEKHMKGISSKIFCQMGYIYGGHGSNGQGIITPIENKMIPLRACLGYFETTSLYASHSISFITTNLQETNPTPYSYFTTIDM
jgi:hypothetical protein